MKTIKETIKYGTGLLKIFDAKTPAQLVFFVTNKCNSRCRHCFYWQSLDNKESELSLEEIKKISSSMGNLIWLNLSGGEPFCRKDLIQICAAFYNNNKPKTIVIPTNGILIKKIINDTAKICQQCPKAKVVIQISIDGLKEKHDYIRGVSGNFSKIEILITQLKKLKQLYPNLAIQANIVYCNYNKNQILNIHEYLTQKHQLDNICLSLIRGQPKEVGAGKIDINHYYQTQQKIKDYKRFKQYSPLLSYLITKKEDMQVDMFIKNHRTNKALIPCLAATHSVVLYPNGDLALCESRPEKYGNLRQANYDFFKLWHQAKRRVYKNKIKGCYCTNECWYTPAVFLNPRVWPKFAWYLIFN